MPDQPADNPAASTAQLRHDLKNHLTALRSGCALIRRHLDRGETEQARAFLEAMEVEIAGGFATVERVR